jgi:hypothetical protein
MNKIFFLIILGVTFFQTSCTDDTSDDIQNDNLIHSDWYISEYTHEGKDETYVFQGYLFEFSDQKLLTAKKGSSVITGTWNLITDSGRQKLIINMNVSDGYFEEISEDWVVIEKTEKNIHLEDLSGSSPNNQKDVLHFSR